MDFRHIQHFVHVAELGSLSKAAIRLNIVQPALSQSIKRLETDMDAILFIRSRKGMELTERGRVFLKYAYGILNQFNRAKESISTMGKNPKGQVSVAMTASTLNVLAVPVSTQLRDKYPDIVLNLEEGLAANIQQGFEAGRYDLVISHLTKSVESIHIEHLIKEDLFLVSPHNFSPKTESIDFVKLADIPLMMPKDHHGVGGEFLKTAEDLGFSIITEQISGALHPTLQLIEAGFGHSILPWSAISEGVRYQKFCAQKIVNPHISHTISMMHPAYKPLTQASRVVMEIIRHSISEIHHSGMWAGELLFSENIKP